MAIKRNQKEKVIIKKFQNKDDLNKTSSKLIINHLTRDISRNNKTYIKDNYKKLNKDKSDIKSRNIKNDIVSENSCRIRAKSIGRRNVDNQYNLENKKEITTKKKEEQYKKVNTLNKYTYNIKSRNEKNNKRKFDKELLNRSAVYNNKNRNLDISEYKSKKNIRSNILNIDSFINGNHDNNIIKRRNSRELKKQLNNKKRNLKQINDDKMKKFNKTFIK